MEFDWKSIVKLVSIVAMVGVVAWVIYDLIQKLPKFQVTGKKIVTISEGETGRGPITFFIVLTWDDICTNHAGPNLPPLWSGGNLNVGSFNVSVSKVAVSSGASNTSDSDKDCWLHIDDVQIDGVSVMETKPLSYRFKDCALEHGKVVLAFPVKRNVGDTVNVKVFTKQNWWHILGRGDDPHNYDYDIILR